MKVLGLMSGTSVDGIDAVLASFSGPLNCPRWHIHRSASTSYPLSLRNRLVAIGQGESLRAEEILDLGEAVTEEQALAARTCDPTGEARVRTEPVMTAETSTGSRSVSARRPAVMIAAAAFDAE